jgi:hypothetical protein
MAQLHCYVQDSIAKQLQNRANQMGLTLSKYLAELIKRDVAANTGWPEGYFENFGTWEGEKLKRPEQLPLENRMAFK